MLNTDTSICKPFGFCFAFVWIQISGKSCIFFIFDLKSPFLRKWPIRVCFHLQPHKPCIKFGHFHKSWTKSAFKFYVTMLAFLHWKWSRFNVLRPVDFIIIIIGSIFDGVAIAWSWYCFYHLTNHWPLLLLAKEMQFSKRKLYPKLLVVHEMVQSFEDVRSFLSINVHTSSTLNTRYLAVVIR